MLAADDWAAIRLTLELAAVTTLILLLLGTPLAWWLAHSQSRWRPVIGAITTLPLVLPPTVIGFYLLLLLGPHGPVGQITQMLGIGTLPFTFSGLVVASLIYSLPFVVQPLQGAFISLGQRPLELAASLRASPLDRFFHVVLPLTRPGFFTAAVMGFAHTVGEFGVVLMIGGNISGQTRVVSVQIYDQVEKMNYGQAHWLSAGAGHGAMGADQGGGAAGLRRLPCCRLWLMAKAAQPGGQHEHHVPTEPDQRRTDGAVCRATLGPRSGC